MDEYKSNSNKSKEMRQEAVPSQKKITKIVNGSISTKKKGLMKRCIDVLISEDASNVKNYIFTDAVIPWVRNAIYNIICDGARITFGGSKKSNYTPAKVSYRDCNDIPLGRRDNAPQRTHGFDYDNIIFDNRGDAEAVLSAMQDIIDSYGTVSVGDLYELAGVTTTNYAVNKYGWTDIYRSDVRRVSGGYVLRLPRAIPLN